MPQHKSLTPLTNDLLLDLTLGPTPAGFRTSGSLPSRLHRAPKDQDLKRTFLVATVLDHVCLPWIGAIRAPVGGPMETNSDSEDYLPLCILPPWKASIAWSLGWLQSHAIGHKSQPSLDGEPCSSLGAVWSTHFLLLPWARVVFHQERPVLMTCVACRLPAPD